MLYAIKLSVAAASQLPIIASHSSAGAAMPLPISITGSCVIRYVVF